MRKYPTKEYDLNQEKLKELLSYDKDTGFFTWKISMKGCGGAVKIGKIAGSKDSKGKVQIKINKNIYFAHRLAFLYTLGKWPDNEVDHINRTPDDNRWENLRDVTSIENTQNRIFNRKDKLPRGVYRTKYNKFFSVTNKNKKYKYLGCFDTPEEASSVYEKELKSFHLYDFIPIFLK